MIHYSCDRCGKEIDSADDHFLLALDLRPADGAMTLTEEDIDADHLHQLSETLKQIEEKGEGAQETFRPRKLSFDLCGCCREAFMSDPLGVATTPKLNFSEN